MSLQFVVMVFLLGTSVKFDVFSLVNVFATYLIALITVLSAGVRSSTETSHWHPLSSYTSSVAILASAAREIPHKLYAYL